MERVFVYGTLMKGFGNHGFLKSGAIYMGTGVMRGALYHLGGYPGVIEGRGDVTGEIYELRDDRILASLDCLEGYSGGGKHNLFTRIMTNVEMHEGNSCRCWAYFYESAEEAGRFGTLVEHGDWRRFMQEKEARQWAR